MAGKEMQRMAVFFLELSWRGNTYNVFYKYSAGPKHSPPGPIGQDGISSWYLADMPHGVSNSGAPDYMVHWEVKRLDARGGLIRAKMWPKNKPQCFAFADFSWDFSQEVSHVTQGEAIRSGIGVEIKPGADCKLPLDPKFTLSVMKGVKWNTNIGGEISLAGQDLFAYATEEDKYKRVDLGGYAPVSTASINLIVKDQTSAGRERDAEDGGFFLELRWRENVYHVYYKYLASSPQTPPIPAKENTPAGTWDTKWDGGSSTMMLQVEGNRVVGTYDYKNGRIEGTLSGRTVTGRWSQSNGSGDMIITFHRDFTAFTIRYKDSGTWYSNWTGTRMK